MATSLEKLCRANRWRVRAGEWASSEVDGWNGHFVVPLDGEMWHVVLSDGAGWKHLSVANIQKRILPSWTTMCRLKDAFFDDADWVVQFHPAKEDNINDHPYCLHLWLPLNEDLPHPSFVLV